MWVFLVCIECVLHSKDDGSLQFVCKLFEFCTEAVCYSLSEISCKFAWTSYKLANSKREPEGTQCKLIVSFVQIVLFASEDRGVKSTAVSGTECGSRDGLILILVGWSNQF